MSRPTKQEYEEARLNIKYIENWMSVENKKIDKLLDEICLRKNYIETYKIDLEKAEKIINKYEFYQEEEKDGDKE